MSEPGAANNASAPPPPAGEKPSHRGRWTAIVGAIGVAVVGATAAAVITPDRIDAIFGAFNPAPTATASPSPTALQMQSVSSADGGLTLEIPESWSYRPSRWNVNEDAGTGLLVGTQLFGSMDFRNDGGWVGASTEILRTAQVADMTVSEREQWIDAFIDVDWTIEGCIPVNDQPVERTGWMIASRTWKECGSTNGQRMVEFAALSDDLKVLVIGQISLTEDVTDEVFPAIVSAFVVIPDKLPVTAVSGDLVTP